MVLPEPGGDLHDGWLTRVMRILFGWKASATRADLELVLTAGGPNLASRRPKPRCSRIFSGCANAGSRASWCRAPTSSPCSRTSPSALVKVFADGGHSRLVVYNDTLDDPVGMLHIRDLLAFMAARAAIDPAAAGDKEQGRETDLDLGKIDLTMPLEQPRSSATFSMRRRPCRRSICSPRCRPRAFISL